MTGTRIHPGGMFGAVTEYLAKRVGSRGDIVLATGYSRTSVEVVIAQLEEDESPLLSNLVDRDREPPLTRCDTTGIVREALAKRSPLEVAWR